MRDEGWLARINDAVNVRLLRVGECFDDSSRAAQVIIVVLLIVAVAVSFHYLGITGSRRRGFAQ